MRKILMTTALSVVFIAPCHKFNARSWFDPRDTDRNGYVDCEEDPNPDPVTDIPCGFRDGIPVGER